MVSMFEPKFGDLIIWEERAGMQRIVTVWLGWVPDRAYGRTIVLTSNISGFGSMDWRPGRIHDFLPEYLRAGSITLGTWRWEPCESGE